MRRGLLAIGCALVGLATPPAHAAGDGAEAWLQRMTESLASLNYDGLFTHSSGNQSETMRIVHRVENGRSMERLVSLDGSGREIVRTPEEVHFYMPDRRMVLVEPRSDDGSLLRAWASHKSMAARDGSDEPPGPDQGRNPEVDFRGKKRSNATHVSRTDPESLLASKGAGMAFLSYTTHALAENRHGLIVDVHTTPAGGGGRVGGA